MSRSRTKHVITCIIVEADGDTRCVGSCLDTPSNLSWPDNGNENKRLKLLSMCAVCRSLLEKCNIHSFPGHLLQQECSENASLARALQTKANKGWFLTDCPISNAEY
jgi:hypothetical protein